MSDRILGGVGLLLALFFIWQATLIQESPFSDIVGPTVFPIIICAVLGLSALYFLVKPDAEPTWPPAARLFEIAMAVAVMLAYAQLLPVLGFLIATALASAYLTWRLGSPPLQSVLVGVLTSGGIYLVFRVILGLSLAKGPFGF
ncbi:tripartite tricarboxylate transporter TctB family protein [Thalassococcus sp. CAU 1522]|uniref:Tripartite tricarboxylate transporter TctB family protein n=1 Tax=Thalassococcus arenae TaxID=2851652 RepID=A0ABS6NC26_9RHOB|nr:tripartite tricarboxylate transporter TctB family protein [Thalassococcus arenae]MBV2361565.1 tripartite tricarboxylate transporter TctB family protein [Thalassococcus arenae]